MNKNIKQFISLIVIILVVVIGFIVLSKNQNMVVVQEGNTDKKPYEIVLGKYQDSDCGMIIDDIEYASQVIAADGKTWFFHDHGGMANWLLTKPFKNETVIWVMAKDTKEYINGKQAWYSRTDITPMAYGFGAYKVKQDGFVDFETMLLLVGRGEDLRNPYIKAKLLADKK
jgi:hypothetical protein